MVTQGLAVADTRSSLADRLDRIADDIDDETAKVSGGLLLIGGAVALINPLLGVGIAAKALLPAVGAKAMKVGTEYIGEKLRTWSRSSAESRIRSEVVGKMSKLEPEVVANPLLRALDAVVTNPSSDYDPAFDHTTWPEAFASSCHYQITTEAIGEVYAEMIGGRQSSGLPSGHLQWLKRTVGDRSQP